MAGPLSDRVTAKIADIDTQIKWIQDESKGRIQTLNAQRDALLKANAILSPEVEDAANFLQRVGVIKIGG